MILLDTNVVSEALRPVPDERVVAWLDAQSATSLFLSCINAAELYAGVALMPSGHRRTRTEAAVDHQIRALFSGRFINFDIAAAQAYAHVLARTRHAGTPIGAVDAQIAAIALVHQCSVATRDTRPFLAAGVRVINPWTWRG